MCGRITVAKPDRVIRKFSPDKVRSILDSPRYNICPGQKLGAMIRSADERVLGDLQWGLVPSWAEDPKIGYKMINARSETVEEKPAFRKAFRKRRCLVVADGFYEWSRKGKAKQPHYFRVDDGDVFAMAGLYEIWRSPEGDKLSTCTIITTTPNDVMEPVHHRMPVILDEENWETWLDPMNEDVPTLKALLQPYTSARMSEHAVSTIVNSPANDSPSCIEPLPA